MIEKKVKRMRINSIGQVSQLYAANTSPKSPIPDKTSTTDRLEISSFGKEFQVAKAAVAGSASESRTKHVDQIKQQIQSGLYSVSPQAFADKMISKIDQVI